MGASESNIPPQYGYHVLQVQPSSPGEKAGLMPFFDFIIAAAGISMTREDSQFVDILRTNIGREVKLLIFNIKTEKARETILIPSNSWGGSGLAGMSIRFAPIEHATERVWHVLDVYPDSPASSAGLESRTDYIVGTPELLLSDSEDFFTLVASNNGKDIPLYVYSTNTDNIRLVHIVPNSQWGGSGSLGCDIGYGYLHRIPMNRNIPSIVQPIVPGKPVPHPVVPQTTQPVVPQTVSQPVVPQTATQPVEQNIGIGSNLHIPAAQVQFYNTGVSNISNGEVFSPPMSPNVVHPQSQFFSNPTVPPYTTLPVQPVLQSYPIFSQQTMPSTQANNLQHSSPTKE